MFVCILLNSHNNILEGILQNKIILILQILLVVYYFIISFVKRISFSYYICPYFLFATFFYIMFYLGDVKKYEKLENHNCCTVFILTFPITIIVFELFLKNTNQICKGYTLKVEENLKLKFIEIERQIKKKDAVKFKSEDSNNKENCALAMNIVNTEDEYYNRLNKEQLIEIKEKLTSFENENFKFSFKNILIFLFRRNIKSLVNSN